MNTITRISTLALVVVSLATLSVATADDPAPVGDILKASPGDWVFLPAYSDEFEGKQVNTKKWVIDPQDFGTWSWEPENVFQKDGAIHLQMVQNTHQRGKRELHYKSGMARNMQTITYGYFEARVKGCSRFPGASPAFWLYSIGPQNRYRAKDGETVAYSEIDIIELQQSEYDFKKKKHNGVNHIDCNLHTTLLRDGKRQWIRPGMNPTMCKSEYEAPWDPREDFHIYAVENTPETIVWYIDGKEVARKPNLYWHLPMHVTLSLGLRYPFEAYRNGERVTVPEKTTKDGFPTAMSVDYVRVWRSNRPGANGVAAGKKAATDMTKAEFIAMEKVKWKKNGWQWNQEKVEANFVEIDTNKDGLASGKEREIWYAKKKASAK